jgi:hypothetical protein
VRLLRRRPRCGRELPSSQTNQRSVPAEFLLSGGAGPYSAAPRRVLLERDSRAGCGHPHKGVLPHTVREVLRQGRGGQAGDAGTGDEHTEVGMSVLPLRQLGKVHLLAAPRAAHLVVGHPAGPTRRRGLRALRTPRRPRNPSPCHSRRTDPSQHRVTTFDQAHILRRGVAADAVGDSGHATHEATSMRGTRTDVRSRPPERNPWSAPAAPA